jgi:hypothetical protein
MRVSMRLVGGRDERWQCKWDDKDMNFLHYRSEVSQHYGGEKKNKKCRVK